ncbi:TetR/AcrR family transcriptional regulator [Rhodococcus sp. G-MC3]|uniref:TetR/AcrR family transcriptional regulator n=1 Tax=Rhodococcus sp. G-MC3 TaxID=3046209 RepID=UPI0024B9C734|nr:TetR/AcrR family transcriptional regulator [Rhodococcus sp. G-MC3]MDJ0396096.1 TetR/AcrR family transcriptional regulator [Rhodococcus sp. G-MC3]
MPSNKERPGLTREAWITAAFEVLMKSGPRAVAVEPLARVLGATKGSFYWHFDNREELFRCALERWEEANTAEVIALIDRADDDPRVRARALIDLVTGSDFRRGELDMLVAADNPDIATALKRVTEARIDYVKRLLVAAGFTDDVARRRAFLAYSSYLGRMQLSYSVPETLPATSEELQLLADEFMVVLFGPG